MSSVVLDTQSLIWLLETSEALGPTARGLADEALSRNALFVSAFSFWEVAMLATRGKITIDISPGLWREKVLGHGILERPMTGEIGVASVLLDDFHPDPADRIITATALITNALLITSDRKILGWNGPLARQDARQ